MARTLILLWTAVAVAVATISGFAWLSWTRQRELAARGAVAGLEQQLTPFRDDIAALLLRYETHLLRQIEAIDGESADGDLIKSLAGVNRSPLVAHVLAIDLDGRVVYPQRISGLYAGQQNTLRDALQVLQELPRSQPTMLKPVGKTESGGSSRKQTAAADATGSRWVAWYHNRGLMLGYRWYPREDVQAMAVLPRGRWLADILAELPETPPEKASDRSLAVRLRDASGQTIHQWGRTGMTDAKWAEAPIVAELPLSPP